MAVAIYDSVKGTKTALTSARKVMILWMAVWALTHIPDCGGMVACNEYDTCLPAKRQLNLTDAIREGHKQQACVIASSAMKCLEEARKDCDDARYENMPDYIVRGLENKKNNMTVYVATYCVDICTFALSPIIHMKHKAHTDWSKHLIATGGNGGSSAGVSVTVTVGCTMLLSVYLSGQ